MNNIEEELWNYIDGTCTVQESQVIALLIASDETYSRKYEELLKLNQDFAGMEIDDPRWHLPTM